MSDVTILFAGDFCPINRVEKAIVEGRGAEVYGDVLGELGRKDLSVVNLECPLSKRGSRIKKSGPNLRGRPETVGAITLGGFDVACMANNHIADYGDRAFNDTVKLLRRHAIMGVGAGRSLGEAQEPLRVRRKGMKISLLAFAENEFCCADERTAGAWPLDPIENISQIRRERERADIVIAMVHGGNETNPYPSPRMIKTYRAFAEAGASAVIGTHPHTPQGIERHNGSPIFYSIGNFVFDWPGSMLPTWWMGYLARVTFPRLRSAGTGREGAAVKAEAIPFRMDPQTARLSLLKGAARREFDATMRVLSKPLSSPGEIRQYWRAWCAMKGRSWMGYLNSTTEAIKQAKDFKNFLAARNALMCEAHHEVLCTYMEMVRKRKLSGVRRHIARIKRLQSGRPAV